MSIQEIENKVRELRQLQALIEEATAEAEAITDTIKAQEAMRPWCQKAGACLMMSTMLHSIATGNLLPAAVTTVCVDINPAVVTKLADRGSFQTIGIITDVGLFLKQLADELEC